MSQISRSSGSGSPTLPRLPHGQVAYAAAPAPRAELDARRKAGYAALDAMERHLAGREFLVADRFTIADIALYAYTHVAGEGGFDLSPYPSVRAWLDRVASQPGHVPITA